ncbi:hypothetical protein H0H81_009888 [Sphagnurus paluster]|uniref:Uncharacterized protein n=1 Tax=Sphagnurus paluster TaxID=117069 RepID=A0A9P7GWE9_9AGAR|nr:hypothetical protein H0H81_009888 [Sphagnurus paluster]
MSATFANSYDPKSASEQPVALPSAPPLFLSEFEVLQPPLSRRGTGPGIILILPPPEDLNLRTEGVKPLDPEPVQKWAEEGFAVAGVTPKSPDWSFQQSLESCIDSLVGLEQLDISEKFAIIVYDPKLVTSIISSVAKDPRIAGLVFYGSSPSLDDFHIPTMAHLTVGSTSGTSTPSFTTHVYPSPSPYFVLPQVVEYDPGSSSLSHSRTLVFLRKWLGGPTFDLEAIWEEHTYFEFEDRSVAKTMGTMVVCL